MASPFSAQIESRDGVARIALTGELDMSTVPQLEHHLDACQADGVRAIVVDLGDLGFVDSSGYLYVTGRLKDLIILGGENVIPLDVEEVVDQVPGVRYSAAVGLTSERTGSQRLHVVAEVRDAVADASAMAGLVREIVQRVHQARGHRPARVLLVRPSTIPKTSSGKIQRAALGRMIAEGLLSDQLVYASGAQGD